MSIYSNSENKTNNFKNIDSIKFSVYNVMQNYFNNNSFIPKNILKENLFENEGENNSLEDKDEKNYLSNKQPRLAELFPEFGDKSKIEVKPEINIVENEPQNISNEKVEQISNPENLTINRYELFKNKAPVHNKSKSLSNNHKEFLNNSYNTQNNFTKLNKNSDSNKNKDKEKEKEKEKIMIMQLEQLENFNIPPTKPFNFNHIESNTSVKRDLTTKSSQKSKKSLSKMKKLSEKSEASLIPPKSLKKQVTENDDDFELTHNAILLIKEKNNANNNSYLKINFEKNSSPTKDINSYNNINIDDNSVNNNGKKVIDTTKINNYFKPFDPIANTENQIPYDASIDGKNISPNISEFNAGGEKIFNFNNGLVNRNNQPILTEEDKILKALQSNELQMSKLF